MMKFFKIKMPLLGARSITGILILALLFSCKKSKNGNPDGDPTGKPPVVVDNDLTELTKSIQAGSTVIDKFVSDETSTVAEGVTQTQIVFNRKDGLPVKMFILKADMNNPKLSLQAMSAYNDLIWGVQRVSEMCRDNQATGTDIVAAVNGDVFNTSTGEPTTVFYVNGTARKTVTNATLTSSGKVFLAYYKDRSLKIGGKDRTNALRTIDYTQVAQAIGGNNWLVDNGVKTVSTDANVDARTAVGYTSGKILYALVVDGRQAKYSNGLTLNDTRDVLFSLGVVDAISLDGAISSTLAVKNAGTNTWSVRNSPPAERLVANGLAFVLSK